MKVYILIVFWNCSGGLVYLLFSFYSIKPKLIFAYAYAL